MQPATRPQHTFAEYLEIEAMSHDVRHEYVGGEIFAMAGGTRAHSSLATVFASLLFTHLDGGPCQPHGSDLRIRIPAADVATYADVAVVCEPVEFDPESPTHVTNPVLVVEVLSPSTERYDREQKRLYYQQLDSLIDYVVVAQDRRAVEVWTRTADGWTHAAYGSGDAAPLASIGYRLDVDRLYTAARV